MSRRLGWLAGLILLVAAIPAAADAPAGRIWFYRQFSPAEPPTPATVRIGGQVVGTAIPGHRFYRDLAPGTYHLSVDSYGTDIGQDRDIALAPGQEVFVRIESLRSWAKSFSYSRDTFYVWPVPPAVGRAELAQTAD